MSRSLSAPEKIIQYFVTAAFIMLLMVSCSSNDDGTTIDGDVDSDLDGDSNSELETDGDCSVQEAVSGELKDCSMTDLNPPQVQGMSIGFVNSTEDIAVRLVREPIPESFNFGLRLRGFAIEQDGLLACIKENCALDYEYSHHNWLDVVHVQTIEGKHHLSLTYQPKDNDPMSDWIWTFEFWTTDESDKTIKGPMLMDMSDCKVITTGEDCMYIFE